MGEAKLEADFQRAGVDPLETSLMESAANGDAAALAVLAFVATQPESYNHPTPRGEALATAEAFARLAVVHGKPEDMFALADILAQRSNISADTAYQHRLRVEAASWLRSAMERGHPTAAANLAFLLSVLADSGDEAAGVDLNRLMDHLAPAEAESMRKAMDEARQFAAAGQGER